jgi:hypothetical protein
VCVCVCVCVYVCVFDWRSLESDLELETVDHALLSRALELKNSFELSDSLLCRELLLLQLRLGVVAFMCLQVSVSFPRCLDCSSYVFLVGGLSRPTSKEELALELSYS